MRAPAIVAPALLGALCCLAPPAPTSARPPDDGPNLSLFPAGYLDHEALTAALRRLADAHPETVRLRSLAKTAEGRDVWLATLGRAGAGDRRPPAILIVANLEADHLVGSQVALGLVERLAGAEEGDLRTLLEERLVYVVPRLNPDGAERVLKAGVATRTNLARMDRDRDGRRNEDGPEDLDGDGVVARMRAKDAKATLVPDTKDPRILRPADAARGERPAFSEYAEGRDDDGDGRLNEDPPGGVNLNRNWPHRWTEFDPEAGWTPASEPEVHALIRFAFDHPEIAVVWTFGLNDNLKAEPKKQGSTLADADFPYFAELSRLFTKANAPPRKEKAEEKKEEPRKAEEAKDEDRPAPKEEAPSGPLPEGYDPSPASLPGLDATTDGAMSEWAYHQYGVVGLASRLWDRPEIPEAARGGSRPPEGGEALWLFWNDKVMDGRAFLPLKPFDHPTLGRVEVGGWRPGVRLNPPIEQVKPMADAQLAFLKNLGGRLPRLEVPEVKVEARGGRLFQISAVVANAGGLPSALAQGVKTRKADPVLVRLEAGRAKILAGRALERIDALPGAGGRRDYRWLVSAPEGVDAVTLEVSCPKAGRVTKTIGLR